MQFGLRATLSGKINKIASAVASFSYFGVALLWLPFLLLMGLCVAGFALTVVFAISIIVGILAGYALPTTAIFWFDWVKFIAGYDHYAAHALLATASFCAVANALSSLAANNLVERYDVKLVRFLSGWGFPVIAALFIFAISRCWVGLERPADVNISSIGGMVPFSDAAGYTAAAFDELKDGVWNAIALRRPLASAFRSILLIAGGLSYTNMLLIQALLAAFATWLAARSIAKWSGAAAGFAFVALAYAIQRSFLSTALTEPLGLIWALLSIPFIVAALRNNSIMAAQVAFGLTVLTSLTRMGAMFLIPAIILWMILNFGKGWNRKIGILAAAIAILFAVLMTNKAVVTLYGRGSDLTGSNFAYVACGLSIGGNWSACYNEYPDEIKGKNEEALTNYFYSKAAGNIWNDPMVISRRLYHGGVNFIQVLPELITQGFAHPPPSVWLHPNIFIVVATLGLIITTFRNWKAAEILFWGLAFTSIVASGAFVFFDGGTRVMSASYPLIAALWVRGLQRPSAQTVIEPVDDRQIFLIGGFIATAVAVSFIAIPGLAYKFIGSGSIELRPAAAVGEHLIYGGRRMSGFLVVADGEMLPIGTPSLHISEFKRIIEYSGIEYYQGLVTPQAPATPFGYIYAARAEPGLDSFYSYVVPSDVITRKDVSAWRLKIEEWQRKPGLGPYWYFVPRADPLEPQ
jgi:hypothetical protein